MNRHSYVVRWTGKETLRYEAGDLVCDMACYLEPDRKGFLAVLPSSCLRNGKESQLSEAEITQVEGAVRDVLGVRRFLGLPIGKKIVHVQREQHVS